MRVCLVEYEYLTYVMVRCAREGALTQTTDGSCHDERTHRLRAVQHASVQLCCKDLVKVPHL